MQYEHVTFDLLYLQVSGDIKRLEVEEWTENGLLSSIKLSPKFPVIEEVC